MDEDEFREWLETCPMHDWEINHHQEDGCMVIFRWETKDE